MMAITQAVHDAVVRGHRVPAYTAMFDVGLLTAEHATG